MSKYIEIDCMPPAVRAAHQVVDLWEANQALLADNERLRKFEQMYYDLLNESVKRGQEDVGNWMKLLLSDRIQFVESAGE